MGKHTKYILILLFFAQAFMVAPLFARAITDNDYTFTGEKIYQRIDTITFVFSGTTLNYGVTMASRFDNVNNTHVRLRFDVFIHTADDNYVTMMEVNLTYGVTFTINNQVYQRTGEVSDQSSFYQTDDLLYTYEVCSVDVPANIFPATVVITFIYNFESDGGEFNVTDTATASRAFLGATIMAIIVIAIIAGVVLTIVLVVRAAKRRRAARYKARAAITRPGFQAGVQAPAHAVQGMPPTYGTPLQAGVPGSLMGMVSPQEIQPSVTLSPTICPSCGGNVMNFKCQSCGGKVCGGCGHLSIPNARFCEKCGKNL